MTGGGDSRTRRLLRRLFRPADVWMWWSGAIYGTVWFGPITPKISGLASTALDFVVGWLIAMVFSSTFRAIALLRRAHDRRLIATQQQEIREEAATGIDKSPDPAGPSTYRWSLGSGSAGRASDAHRSGE